MILSYNHYRDGSHFIDLGFIDQVVSVPNTTPPIVTDDNFWDIYTMTNSSVTLPSRLAERGIFKAMPTSATDLATDDCALVQLIVENPTAGAITFTIADKAGSPLTVWNAKSVAAGAEYVFRAAEGAWFSGGLTISSSSSGLVYSMVLFLDDSN